MSNSVRHSPLSTSPAIEKNLNIPWWNRRTKLEKILCIVTLITLIILCVMTVILASSSSSLHQKSTDNSSISSQGICLTAGCIKTAASVREIIDERIDPCQNFYHFACGGYLENNEIPDDKSHISTYTDVEDRLNLKLKILLKKPQHSSESRLVKMIKDMYDSCMDLKTIEEANSEPLRVVLNTFGGWPVVVGDRWDETKFDWLETLFSFRRHGFDHKILLGLSVDPDIRSNKNQIIMLDQNSLGMPGRTYLVKGLSDSATAAYFKLMVRAANKLGANEATSEKELMEALNFEMALADYSVPAEERRNMSSSYNKYTVKKLQKLVPQVDWLKYLNGLLNDPIMENETILVIAPEFVKKFGELIATTDKRTIANYMIWRVVHPSLAYLSKEWRDLNQEYTSVVSGASQTPPRWKECIGSIYSSLGLALSSYYVKNFFQEENKKKALELVKYVRQEFLNILDNIDWMDDNTKAQARDKAKAMKSFIGYPQQLLDNDLVLKFYENVAITNDSYFNNTFNLRKRETDNEFNKLREPHMRGDWRDHTRAAIVNAFHDYRENSIDFTAAILQNPLFDEDRPYYMNFGGIGYVIGHEITHGFDDTGRQFDKNGNNRNWWDGTTDEKFKEKSKCIVYQYGNYTAEYGLQVNGIKTQGENIADNGGLKEAYLAYQSWVRDHGAEQKLPGLKYTPNQLLFISAAHVRCAKYRAELLKLILTSDSHSPGQFRVIGPMSNFPEFSKEFECPPGSPMNPHKKCQVW